MRRPLLLALLAAATACAGTAAAAPPSSAAATVRSAYETTVAARTADVVIHAVYYDVRPPVTVPAHGVVDLAAPAYDLTAFLPRSGATVYRLGHGYVYEHSSSPGSPGWTKLDLATVLRRRPVYGLGREPTDPVLLLGYTAAISGPVHRMGTQSAAGRAATRYRAVVDLRALARRPGIWSDLAPVVAQRLGTTRLPIDLWLDPHGRVVRERLTLPLSGVYTIGKYAGKPRVTVTMDLSKFGTPATAGTPAERARDITADVIAGRA